LIGIAILCEKYAPPNCCHGWRPRMRGQNNVEADQLPHPPICEASVDIFGHERAINFTHGVKRSDAGRG
jgi:hypothetical protein